MHVLRIIWKRTRSRRVPLRVQAIGELMWYAPWCVGILVQQREVDDVNTLDLYCDSVVSTTEEGGGGGSGGGMPLALMPPWWQHIDRWSGWRGGVSATSNIERFSIVDTVSNRRLVVVVVVVVVVAVVVVVVAVVKTVRSFECDDLLANQIQGSGR